ncbi:MAG: glucans biosynthesis glucosyltransferase MdoH [Pseudomonadota bacterium]
MSTTIELDPPKLETGANATTPTGLQSRSTMLARRVAVLTVNLITIGLLTWGIVEIFGKGGWSLSDIVILVCFLIGVPWTVMGMWNAFIGLWLLHGRRDGLGAAAPHMTAPVGDGPLVTKTALAMTLRNEDTTRALDRLVAIRQSLNETGQGAAFDVFVLSDSSDPDVIAEEEREFHARRADLGGLRAQYRRREVNTGFKAGNVRDFLTNQGRDYDFYLPLDSDSLMSGDTILRMVRIMEAHPRLGILQSLVVGTPAQSAFARIFQFGMRHGMRSFTMGAAWWQGDCGPYWGHNAVIRVKPFRRFCRLPMLPGRPPLGGHVLSHDQIEAVMIRRAGYEVRVIPVETESWEDNPPTLMDFTKRDLRWCQGNMQYFRLLGMRDLQPVSRFQVFAAIMMYIGAPAWMLMTLAAAWKIVEGMPADINAALAIAMFFIMFTVSLVPKLIGLLDIALTPGGAARYGGRLRFAIGGVIEAVFSVLLAPVVAFRVTMFLIGLIFGKSMMWNGQNRDAYRLSWGDAAQGLWPQTLFGALLGISIAVGSGVGTLVWAAPMLGGLLLSIPLAVLTAHPRFGAWAARVGLCATPDEVALPRTLRRLGQGAPSDRTAVADRLKAA